ncbi:hypothetical protein YOLOSWAG_326 [Erwinia phage vB_EamM_Yoloswag]|uniref:Uncharacterized protein n=1 Tax=Erwinia phage vB_EamM_Yoloswag TaxID=1958956 RepID=A0A1S6L3N1_9CAUD|nr:hypothetical protein HOR66_gp326 [Erwinia phage vB_EamM_Yoloswag]AQT28794.1 hypothetical protein YOLOSWAG_326 [Erwinia phage vB_EamM_Yoloswag]
MKNKHMTFPVVKGTERWPVPLFDIPDMHIGIELTSEQRNAMDCAVSKLRQLSKDRDFCTKYGTKFVASQGDSF